MQVYQGRRVEIMVPVFWLLAVSVAFAARPVETVWIRGVRPVGATGSVARIQPDVHSVQVDGGEVVVRSAGISLAYLGVLHAAAEPRQEVREFVFRFPQKPEPATGVHAHFPLEYGGAFVNGVPIYNQFEAASYRGQNLWHYDLVARNSNPQPGLLEGLDRKSVV